MRPVRLILRGTEIPLQRLVHVEELIAARPPLKKLHARLEERYRRTGDPQPTERATIDVDNLIRASLTDFGEAFLALKERALKRLFELQDEVMGMYEHVLRSQDEKVKVDLKALHAKYQEMQTLFRELAKPAARMVDDAGNASTTAAVATLVAPPAPPPLRTYIPPARQLAPGPSVPVPALSRLVVPGERNIQRGLRVVQRQNAVPPLEAALTSMAVTDPAAVRQILDGIGRHFRLNTVNDGASIEAIKGIARFLEVGGQPSTLAVALGLGDTASTGVIRTVLAQFKSLSAAEAKGLDVIVRVRGIRSAATDSIAGIAMHHPQPGPIYVGLAEIEPYTANGLEQLIRQLASDNPALRQEALVALQDARALIAGGTSRLEFNRQTLQGVQALRVRDTGVTGAKLLKAYTPAELDQIVATTPDINAIRTLAANMVQGSAGSLFERWINHYVFHNPIGAPAPRLTVRQVDNIHLRLTASERVSDGYLRPDGSWWDAKAYSKETDIDVDQLSDTQAMVRAKKVYTKDLVEHPVTSANYIFIDLASARRNRSLVHVQGGGVVWYIDDFGMLQLLP